MSDLTPDVLARLMELFGRELPDEPEIPEAAPTAEVVEAMLPAATPLPPPAPRKRARLYSSERRGFMRATREEGIGEEIKAMRAEAQGSPFFDSSAAPAGDVRKRLGLKQPTEQGAKPHEPMGLVGGRSPRR